MPKGDIIGLMFLLILAFLLVNNASGTQGVIQALSSGVGTQIALLQGRSSGSIGGSTASNSRSLNFNLA